MFSAAILGESELESGTSSGGSFWDSLGSVSKTLLSAGSNIYALQTQKDVEQLRLEQARVSAPTAPTGSTLLAPVGASMTQQPSSGFPVLPVAIGAGVLGVIYLIVSKKKGGRR